MGTYTDVGKCHEYRNLLRYYFEIRIKKKLKSLKNSAIESFTLYQ